LLPHWVVDVPATQVPAEQHPPLHGWVTGSHCVVQRNVVMSHAVPVGQSVTDLQPQNVWSPVVMHCPPLGLAMQLTQAGTALVTPHVALEFPWVHVPALQQPPLHPRFPAHDVEHV
jgi:hypothetical protein